MNRQWRQVLPPPGFIKFFCILYLLPYLIDLLAVYKGIPAPEETGRIRVTILILASIFYGIYRVADFNPFYNNRYCLLLILSPWSIKKPLPWGPVHLISTDFVILILTAFLTRLDMPSWTFAPIFAFLIAYLLAIILTIHQENNLFDILFFFIAPFAFYPFANVYAALFVLAVLYALCYLGLYLTLKNFPWNTFYWKGNIVEEYKKQAIRQRVFDWPFKLLNVYETADISCSGAFILSLLLTWWLHVIRWAIGGPYVLGWIVLVAFIVSFSRYATYAGFYGHPINLMGRIFTGHLIIPRYDKIFIAPICVLLAGTALPFVLRCYGLDAVWNFEICFFLTFFLALSLPPTLKQWRFTGAYSIRRQAQSLQQKPKSPSEQKMTQFFSAKFKPR